MHCITFSWQTAQSLWTTYFFFSCDPWASSFSVCKSSDFGTFDMTGFDDVWSVSFDSFCFDSGGFEEVWYAILNSGNLAWESDFETLLEFNLSGSEFGLKIHNIQKHRRQIKVNYAEKNKCCVLLRMWIKSVSYKFSFKLKIFCRFTNIKFLNFPYA